jgi:ribosomal protein S18 acetylase RimI-like enzyme
MFFRFSSESDFPAVAGLNRELLRVDGHERLFSDEQLCARFRRWLSEGHKLVVFEHEAEVVGYGLYVSGERDTGEKIIYLRHLVIRESHRRRGFGREAMMHLIRSFWPADAMICVETRESNAAAIHFWKSLNFKLFSCTFICEPGEEAAERL